MRNETELKYHMGLVEDLHSALDTKLIDKAQYITGRLRESLTMCFHQSEEENKHEQKN